MSNSNHDPKNKECAIYGEEHEKEIECEHPCTCRPEQKEEWRDRFESRGFTSAIKKASDFNQHQYDLMVNEMGYFMSQELALAEERGRDAQQKEDYEIAKAQQEKAFKSWTEMGEKRGRREAKSQFDAMLAEDIEKIESYYLPNHEAYEESLNATRILEARRLFLKK